MFKFLEHLPNFTKRTQFENAGLYAGDERPSNTVFVSIFRYGKIISTKAIIDQTTNKCKGKSIYYNSKT